MKILIANLFGLFLFNSEMIELVAQNRDRKPECPVIEVVCPERVETGEVMNCSANVSGLDDLSAIHFRWTVLRGVIRQGRNAAAVFIDPIRDGLLEPITATVEVGGLPRQSCLKSASSYLQLVAHETSSLILIEYADIQFETERRYLDVLAQKLHDEPGSRPHIIASAGRNAYENEANERASRAKTYLVEKHGIKYERVVTVDGGFREVRSVELWIEESGALNSPLPTPTLKREEVQMLKGKRSPKL